MPIEIQSDITRLRQILIDQYTAEIATEALGPVLFKGKQQPINVFAVRPIG